MLMQDDGPLPQRSLMRMPTGQVTFFLGASKTRDYILYDLSTRRAVAVESLQGAAVIGDLSPEASTFMRDFPFYALWRPLRSIARQAERRVGIVYEPRYA